LKKLIVIVLNFPLSGQGEKDQPFGTDGAVQEAPSCRRDSHALLSYETPSGRGFRTASTDFAAERKKMQKNSIHFSILSHSFSFGKTRKASC